MARRSEFEQHLFTVEGSGTFPFDMLRYDCCWPYSEGYDSGQLEPHERGKRRVVLATRWRNAPTVGRWNSFNWRVVGAGDRRKEEANFGPAT
jgi:hypothetical protein